MQTVYVVVGQGKLTWKHLGYQVVSHTFGVFKTHIEAEQRIGELEAQTNRMVSDITFHVSEDTFYEN